jgi:RHS repeat-associated protein
MKYKLTFAFVASLTSTAFAAFQAPLPAFKNAKQLAEWRAEKASKATSQGYAAEETAFYTGRPYLASSGDYAFKFRSYDPALARWTSEDPSGFPDGANALIYVKNNVMNSCDFQGLETRTLGGYSKDYGPWNINTDIVKMFKSDVTGSTVSNGSQDNLTITYNISGTFGAEVSTGSFGKIMGSIQIGESITGTVRPGYTGKLEIYWDAIATITGGLPTGGSISFQKFKFVTYE